MPRYALAHNRTVFVQNQPLTPRDYESFPVNNTMIFTVLPLVTPDLYRITYHVIDGETFIPPRCGGGVPSAFV
jgi:hypothetical protein